MSNEVDLWNSSPLDSNGIHPRRESGIVQLNGKLDQRILSKAMNNLKPYWPKPNGTHIDMIRRLRNGDIAYTFRQTENDSSALFIASFNSSINSDSDKTYVFTSINGQGDGSSLDYDNETFMRSIEVVGLISEGTEQNGSDLCNIKTGGTTNMRNSGPWFIRAGDYVKAYAPKPTETANWKTDAERNGYRTLWTQPHLPDKQKLTCTNVYKCITTNSKSEDDFSRDYRETVSVLLESAVDTFVKLSISDFGTALKESILEDQGDNFGVKQDYNQRHRYETKRNELIKEYRTELAEMLFKHSTDKNELISCPLENNLVAEAQLQHESNSLIIGRAITSAGPGQDFEIQLCKYAK